MTVARWSGWSLCALCVAACAGSQGGLDSHGDEMDGGPDGMGDGALAAGVEVPAGAEIVAEPGSASAFLGENVLIHFSVKNSGTTPLSVSFGGDYRGSARRLRYKMVCTNVETGEQAEDPNPSTLCFGGLGGDFEVTADKAFNSSLQLHRYCRIDTPGTYKIRVAHDLGWGGDPWASEGFAAFAEDDPRWTETTVTLSMPDAAQAEKVVSRMESLPEDPNASVGEKMRPYADFSCLRYPVYLPILEKRAKARSSAGERALLGIGEIPTKEATDALIALAAACPPGKAPCAALAQLAMRLPDPQLEGELPPRHPFENPRAHKRRHLSAAAFAPEHGAKVRAFVPALLKSATVTDVQTGAFILEALGTAADVPALTGALDRALAATKAQDPEVHVYPRPRGACQELLRAAEMLLRRGAQPEKSPTAPGQIALYLYKHGPQAPDQRPADYDQQAAQWMDHPIPYVRELVLEKTKTPVPAPVRARIKAVLATDDIDSRIAALRVIEVERATEYMPQVLALVQSANEAWLLQNVSSAASAIDVPADQMAELLIERLDETERTMEVFGLLTRVVFAGVTGSSMTGNVSEPEARRLQAAWREFLGSHRQALASGQRFVPGGGEIATEHLPTGYQVSFEDGTVFP